MDFTTAIKAVHKYAPKEALIPGVETIQIVEKEIMAHDLNSGAVAKINDLGFNCAVNAQQIQKIMSVCSGEPTITMEGSKKKKMMVISGPSGKFKIATKDLESVPAIKKKPKDGLNWIALAPQEYGAIENIFWAKSKDKSRMHMVGVYFYQNYIITLNSHSMARWQIETNVPEKLGFEKDHIYVIPEAAIGLEGDVEIAVDSNEKDGKMYFKCDDITRIASRIPADMPQVDQIFKQLEELKNIEFDRSSLLGAVKRAMVLERSKDPIVVLEYKDNVLTVKTEDIDGKHSYTKSLTPETVDEGVKNGFIQVNGRYFSSALDCVNEKNVKLGVEWKEDGTSEVALKITSGPLTAIIMPMRP